MTASGVRWQHSAASRVAEHVNSATDWFVTAEQIAGPPGAINRELSRLVSRGELQRVRRGLYWRGRLTALGRTPPPAAELAASLAGPRPHGPAAHWAASVLGLTSQVPSMPHFAIVGQAPTGPANLRWSSRVGATCRAAEGLTPVEIAVLEVLRNLDEFTDDPAQARLQLLSMLRDGRVRAASLVAALPTESPNVAREVRDLVEAA